MGAFSLNIIIFTVISVSCFFKEFACRIMSGSRKVNSWLLSSKSKSQNTTHEWT